MKNVVLVTGAAGYIGGQIMLALQDQGIDLIGVDLQPIPPHLTSVPARFLQEDFSSGHVLDLVREHRPRAIMHCAGTSLVGPSMKNPRVYYDNNFVKTKKLLDYIVDQGLTEQVKLIFSSSAAVYGDPIMVPCREEDPPMPMSPYGESKLMVEMLLRSYQSAYGLRFVAFRYFNACGADHLGRHGTAPQGTHIISRVLESVRDHQPFTLNGSNYPTNDGSCVRDYVHVEDIAAAHVKAMEFAALQGIYNLGTSQGISNRQIISSVELVTERRVKIVYGPERPGDPGTLTASADKFNLATGWVPNWTLNDMIDHAWKWHTR